MKTLLVIAALCLSAHAQTWVKVATEADTLTSGPITVRYGASTGTTYSGVNCAVSSCWVTVTLKSATNLSLSDAGGNLFGVADPAPGVAKELDVQEGPAALSVTVSGKAKTVPALPTTTYLLTNCTVSVPTGTLPSTVAVNSGCTLVKQ